jgi:SPRY domain
MLTVVDDSFAFKASKNIINGRFNGVIWDASIHKYTVTVNSSRYMTIKIGYAPSKLFDVDDSNFTTCGWYFHSIDGCRYSQNATGGRAYSSGCKVGDTITCIYNASTSEISFEKNGVSLGVAFTNVNGEDIAPAVELYYDDSITLTID